MVVNSGIHLYLFSIKHLYQTVCIDLKSFIIWMQIAVTIVISTMRDKIIAINKRDSIESVGYPF